MLRLLMMTSLCGANVLPPPHPGNIQRVGLGTNGTAPAALATVALAGAPAEAAAPRSDDPFIAFLRSAGVDPMTLALGPAPAPSPTQVEPEAAAAGGSERIKRTGSVLGPLLNTKLSYLTKGSHHVHFHNYGSSSKVAHSALRKKDL